MHYYSQVIKFAPSENKFLFFNATCSVMKISTLRATDELLFSQTLKFILTKFPNNARRDWLKQRALSENGASVENIKLSHFFLAAS